MDLSFFNTILLYFGWAGIALASINIAISVWEIAFGFNTFVVLARLFFQLVMLYNCISFITSTIHVEKQSVSSLFILLVCFPLAAVSIDSIFVGSIEMMDARARSAELLQRMCLYAVIQSVVRWVLPLKSSL